MEYLDGGELFDRIANESFEFTEKIVANIRCIIIYILEGLCI